MTREPTSPLDPSPRESCPALAMTPFLHFLTWTDNLPPFQEGPGSPAGAEPMSGEDSSDEDYCERDRKSHPTSYLLLFPPVRVRGGLQCGNLS